MKQVNILVEGPTEEIFVKELMAPYLLNFQIVINPVVISTKRIKDGRKFTGGLSNGNFEHFINDLKRLVSSTPHGYVSTFIDYYRLPSKFPGYQKRSLKINQLERVLFLEQSLLDHVGRPDNFIPYIQLHEFEAFHFSDKIGFQNYLSPSEAKLEALFEIVDSYNNPEDINEGANTSPSKRIIANYPTYDKVTEGNLIIMEIGFEKLLNKCPHFSKFVDKLKILGESV